MVLDPNRQYAADDIVYKEVSEDEKKTRRREEEKVRRREREKEKEMKKPRAHVGGWEEEERALPTRCRRWWPCERNRAL